MLIGQGAIDAAKIGVSIALRYACARPQFQGKRIMEYLTHQRRLLPALATTYAMQLQSLRLKVLPDVPLIMHATIDLVAPRILTLCGMSLGFACRNTSLKLSVKGCRVTAHVYAA